MEKRTVARGRRPSWMTPFGREGEGDIGFDRLWVEYPIPYFSYDAETGKTSGKVES
jgi:hypothetical protein